MAVLILGIESSCDETAASIVKDGRQVLSNQIASQIPLHQRWGGVVPEIASRAHLEQILPMVEASLTEAQVSLDQVDAVAVTRGPGLIGCLLVGVEFAKTIALSRQIPLLAVHHTAGHLYSPFIDRETDAWGDSVTEPGDFSPYIGLAISGGHTSLVLAKGPTEFETLGQTLDDAVGEAYDKIAKLIGLGYPGGPIVDQRAHEGNGKAFQFPRPMMNRPGYDFSFSGLKTAFAREVEKQGGGEVVSQDEGLVLDLCASFQQACIDVLIAKAKRAMKDYSVNRLAVVGGVACNKGLRRALGARLRQAKVALPAPEYCTDNAAMIAGVAWHVYQAKASSGLALNAVPQLNLNAPPAQWQVTSTE